jgi:hypothetical protein
MTHLHCTFHPLLLLAALVALPADSYASDSRAEHDVAYRVYYLFDPTDPGQLQRAEAVHRGTLVSHEVEWIGVRLTSVTQVAFAPFALADILARADHLSPPVADWLRAGDRAEEFSDRVLVQNAVTSRTFTGAGSDMRHVAAAAGLGPAVRTDVGVTTWGKVKELFR